MPAVRAIDRLLSALLKAMLLKAPHASCEGYKVSRDNSGAWRYTHFNTPFSGNFFSSQLPAGSDPRE
jgi:hypothetical protein